MFEQFIGTKPVEERHRIDVATLEKFLGFKIAEIEQFKGGQSNPTYKIASQDGRGYVLRRKPPGKLLPSAHAVDREYKVIKALHPTGFPVAKPHVLCEDESVIGTAFYVMDYVEGRVLWDPALPGMTRAQRAAIWDEQNRVISQLHLIDYRAVGLEDFGKPGNYIGRQVERWSKQYRASETQRIEAMDNLIGWLPKNIPPEAGTSVVHGDFRLDNTIFHPSEPRILAVLDWELSTLGDPLADFAYHCMSWHIPPDKFRGIAGLPIEELGISGRIPVCTSLLQEDRTENPSMPRTGTSISPTTCSASRRSARASPSACSTARRRARSLRKRPARRCRLPSSAGT